MTCAELLERLAPFYPGEGWWPSASPFETAVGAILVQGVAWRNAARAVAGLRERELLTEHTLAHAEPQEVEAAVHPALYHRQKAGYLRGFAASLLQQGGLERLRSMPRLAQRERLLAVRGIGEETAAAIMVYALGGAEPVVDAYARRLLPRIGAVGREAGDAAIARAMSLAIDDDASRARTLHAVIVEHAREVCRKSPRCATCPLAVTCPRILGETC